MEVLKMVNVFSEIVQFKGSHYDFGVLQGENLRNSMILTNRDKYVFAKRKRNFIINESAYKKVIDKFAPYIWDEINGLADALKMEVKTAIEQFGGYYLEFDPSGCSVFSGKEYLVRNYDYHPSSYDGRFLLYKPTDQGYATIGPSMQITGRTDGINEKGLTLGYNFVNRRNSGDGFLCNMIGRIVLETCANAKEAVDLLKEIPHRNTFNYILLDKTGTSKVVEASPSEIIARNDNVSTNHFIELTEKNRYHTNDSVRRINLITKKQNRVKIDYDAFKMMNTKEEDIFGTEYKASSGTLHTAIYYPKDLVAGLSLGANRPPFMFDFKKWLAGERLSVKKIKGELDTIYPFANMEQPK